MDQATINAISSLLDAKLEPINNELVSLRRVLEATNADISNMRVQLNGINERLFKIENRMVKVELHIDELRRVPA